MRTNLTSAIKKALLTAGHYGKRLKNDAFPGVAVLCYHGVQADDSSPPEMAFGGLHVRASELAAHCALIREHCNPITLEQWLAALDNGHALPPRPVLMTFDDGYRGISTLAGPILMKCSVPAVVFVCSEPVENRCLLWYDAIARKRGEAEVERIKRLPAAEWEDLRSEWTVAVNETDASALLTVAELKECITRFGFEVGAHTASHMILSCASIEQQREQIVRNKNSLETWIGRPVRAFAYPNGVPGQDYTSDTVELLKELGFTMAFTTRHGFATSTESRLEYSRFTMLAGISQAELAHRLCYSWRR